jgi:hypothetical protein
MKTTTIVSLLLLALTARGQYDQYDDDQHEDEQYVDEDEQQETANLHHFLPVAKAASPQVNCNCQCSNYTYRDKNRRVQGNCRAVDSTGARWCFVDPRYSKCSDLQYAKNRNRSWSRQACATPARSSRLCRGH